MITTWTWTMSITEMLRSPVIVFLTIASCVAGAPVQIEGENISLGQAVYSQPELAAALARTYEALESKERNRENEISTRNLDHIGGGNLLRNLDHIGGGNLLRNLDSQESANSRLVRDETSVDQQNNKQKSTRRPGLASGFTDDPSKWSANRGTLDSLGGGNSVRRRDISNSNEFERNLDHIGGGNLLRNLGTVDPLGGPNTVRRDISNLNEFERNLDHIGGGNLLRNLDSQEFANSRLVRDETSANQQNNKQKSTRRPGWSATRGTLDSIGGPNLVRREISNLNEFERNLDHIGGGNLLRDLGTFDPLGGPNIHRRDTSNLNEFERNLDHIGGGNLLRNLDSQRFARFARSKPFTIEEDIYNYRTTLKPDLLKGFQDDPAKWAPGRGTLDHIGGGILL